MNGSAVRVRWAALPADAHALLPRLSGRERDRVERAVPADRTAVAAALLLARVAVAEACGIEPADIRVDRRCPRCGSTAHGVPRVVRADGGPVPHLSLSRARDLVVVALAGSPVGVDVEPVTATPPDRGVVLADDEQPAPEPHGLLRSWVRKEAVLKAAGTGLAVDPRTLRVDDRAGVPRVRRTPAPGDPARGPTAASDPLDVAPGHGWWLRDLDLGPTHLVAVALRTGRRTTPTLDAARLST